MTKFLSDLSKDMPDYVRGKIMYLEPSTKTCPYSSAGCRASCLVHGGRLRMDNASKARRWRTEQFTYLSPCGFEIVEDCSDTISARIRLSVELDNLSRTAKRQSKQAACRLNGTSDIDFNETIRWWTPKDIQFYDYTKDWDAKPAAKNHHLTYSATEHHSKWDIFWKVRIKRHNVAVVFDKVPERYAGCRVINGDLTDYRPADPRGVIVGLKAKGKARKDKTGFVRRVR